MEIESKVVLVTGAASGIGLETVKELLKNGVEGVVMVDLNEEDGNTHEATLKKEFGEQRVVYVKADISRKYEFEDAFKTAIEKYGHLDIVINNAGILNDVNYRKCIDVNLGGTTTGTFLGLKYMGKNTIGSGGTIINIASIAAMCKVHHYTSPVYSATKSGIVSLSKGLGHEFHVKETGVKIMVLCPGGTVTSFHDKMQFLNGCLEECGRYYENRELQKADVIAHSIIYILKNGSTGSVWLADDQKLFAIKDYDILENCKELVIENIQGRSK